VARRETLQPLPLTVGRNRPSPHDGGRISSLGVERGFRRDEVVCESGSGPLGLLVLVDGLAREATVTADGRWAVHDLLGAGDVCGSLTTGGTPGWSVRAVRPTRAIVVSPSRFDALMQRRPDLAWDLLRRLERRRDRERSVAVQTLTLAIPKRVRARIAALARSRGRTVPGGGRIEVPLTQEHLAAMVGTTRETVNRTLVRMVADGLIRFDRRRYVVTPRLLELDSP
jgi:CRP/FNR family cyclic AMP-dependent transcriptional regulator